MPALIGEIEAMMRHGVEENLYQIINISLPFLLIPRIHFVYRISTSDYPVQF